MYISKKKKRKVNKRIFSSDTFFFPKDFFLFHFFLSEKPQPSPKNNPKIYILILSQSQITNVPYLSYKKYMYKY